MPLVEFLASCKGNHGFSLDTDLCFFPGEITMQLKYFRKKTGL